VTTRQHPIGSRFGADTTAAEVLAGIDLSGKSIVVTGGYSGIGIENVRSFSAAGATVIVPARRPDQARAALAGVERVEVDELDLADLESVLAFAERLLASGPDRHPPEQRRDHGEPGNACWARLGVAVRDEPPRSLRADQPPA
jgi:NAD(P)-dependent dehydrogenase (short-subunit alcohol dehydrogenase family)